MALRQEMKTRSFDSLAHALLAIWCVLTLVGCDSSDDSVSRKAKGSPVEIARLLPETVYAQASQLASTPREESIVKSCSRLEGKPTANALPQNTIEVMQEVLFESETPEVRAAVAAGLGNAGSVTSVPRLLDALEDDSPVTRHAAAKSVAKLMGWHVTLQPRDSPKAWSEAAEQLRERWLLFEGSDLYQVATDPEARKRAREVAEKRSLFMRQQGTARKGGEQKSATQPETLEPPARRPSDEDLRQQFKLD